MSTWIQVARNANGEIMSIEMPRPSNFHTHFRDGALMEAVAPGMMRWNKHILAMPNNGPIDTIDAMVRYYTELGLIAHRHGFHNINIVMTLYLTEHVTPAVIERLPELPFKVGVKYYPPHKGATTGSGLGIPLSEGREALRSMAANKIPLLGHFESVYDAWNRMLPMLERENYFMAHEFPRLREEHPDLHINIEHATTRAAIEWVERDMSGLTTCGITPQSLLFTTADLTVRSWGNHLKCMPIPKGPDDRDVCIAFATSGDRRAHLGDDSAPHLSRFKMGTLEQAANGCYLPHSLALYARAFENAGALDDRLVQFACFNGPDTWGLPRPHKDDTIRLVYQENSIPEPTYVPAKNDVVIPLGWSGADDQFEIALALEEAQF